MRSIQQSIALFTFIVLIVSCSKEEAPILPVATADPAAQTITSGESTAINLMSSVSGTTYSWTVSQDNVTGAAPGNGSSILQSLTLTTSESGSVSYTITPTANGVNGNTITVVVTVEVGKTTYLSHIKPILVNSCKPCHVAGGSNPNRFDQYDTAKNKINSILDRVQRDQGASGFMPLGGNKLSDSEIATLKKWVNNGLLEN